MKEETAAPRDTDPQAPGAMPAPATSPTGGWWPLIAIILAFGPGILHYATTSLSAWRCADDARQQSWPLIARVDGGWAQDDRIAAYMLDKVLPPAFSAAVTHLPGSISPDLILRLHALGVWVAACTFLMLSGRIIAGPIGGWISLALALSTDAFLAPISGGLPRAAGMAAVSMAAYGVLSLRWPWTAAATLLGALTWYPGAVIGGVLLTLQLGLPRRFLDATGKPPRHRLLIVSLTGLASILLVAPAVFAPSPYGKLIRPGDPAWPEADRGGRFENHQIPGAAEPRYALWRAATLLRSKGEFARPWRPEGPRADRVARDVCATASLAALLFCLWKARTDPVPRRLLLLPLVAVGLHACAWAFGPYLYIPVRYIDSLLPCFLVPAVAHLLVGLPGMRKFGQPAGLSYACTALLVLAIGGRPHEQGLTVRVDAQEREFLEVLGRFQLHRGLFAGWPQGLLDDIPYFARQPVLLNFECHLPYHSQYAAEMRRRAHAVLEAWYAPTPESLLQLRDEFGVRYFAADKSMADVAEWAYFKPFDETIRRARTKAGGRPAFWQGVDGEAVVFENKRYRLIDLAAIPRTPDRRP